MKVYGASICMDCRNLKWLQQLRGFQMTYVDITESTDNLKEFLRIRDKEPLFLPVRERGGIGIPLFVCEDGRMTLDQDEALSWIGEPPVREDEIRERREEDGCASCR